MSSNPVSIQTPPQYCQYTTGACDQSFADVPATHAFFFFSSKLEMISQTIAEGIRKLRLNGNKLEIGSWQSMNVDGKIIFCQICKSQRFTKVAVADVTSLNFNVLFEIGYALGLGIPVVPIRDTTCSLDQREFDELGLLDVLGYVDYQNSDELAARLPTAIENARFPLSRNIKQNNEQPIFVVKTPITNDGQIKLMSIVKKSGLRFRTFDPKETSRLSLQDAFRDVTSSLGIITHLLAPIRRGSLVHNARSAFMAGLGMASGQVVCILQEGDEQRPIDYRDVVLPYSNPNQIQSLMTPFISKMFDEIQSTRFVPITLPLRALESLDFGDVAAENEIKALEYYFVPTAQYNEARRGHARLIVGRKGTGKTAIFYGLRRAFWTSQDQLVIDLKPEGHQFTKLREAVLTHLTRGLQEHVLTAFWTYLLLMEIANKILRDDGRYATRSNDRAKAFEEIRLAYGGDPTMDEGDFSERLMSLVERLSQASGQAVANTAADVTPALYQRDIRDLSIKLSAYLRGKRGFGSLSTIWIKDGR